MGLDYSLVLNIMLIANTNIYTALIKTTMIFSFLKIMIMHFYTYFCITILFQLCQSLKTINKSWGLWGSWSQQV